jgi:hypothetical protein
MLWPNGDPVLTSANTIAATTNKNKTNKLIRMIYPFLFSGRRWFEWYSTHLTQ